MRYFIFFVFSLTAVSLRAQTASDQIYKLDKSIIQGIVDEIGDREIIYFLPKDAAKRSAVRIAKQQVWKIVYGNGEMELINKPAAETPTVAQQTKVTGPAEFKPDRIFLKN